MNLQMAAANYETFTTSGGKLEMDFLLPFFVQYSAEIHPSHP